MRNEIKGENVDPRMPSTYQRVEGNRAYVPSSDEAVNPDNLPPKIGNADLGYASDVCDYNVCPADKNKSKKRNIQLDSSYVQQTRPVSLVSACLKPMSPLMESSLHNRRQMLIQKRAMVFKSMENLDKDEAVEETRLVPAKSVTNIAVSPCPSLSCPINVENCFERPNFLQAGDASKEREPVLLKLNGEFESEAVDNAVAGLATQSSLEEDGSEKSLSVKNQRLLPKSTSGIRAKIACRKLMKQAQSNTLDVPHGSLSDQDAATSENNDEDDSIEEKQDSEPMNDDHSFKNKTNALKEEASPAELTQETARRNWNSRFSDIKNSFSTASEEELNNMKSRSPSINRHVEVTTDSEARGRPKVKSKLSGSQMR